MKKEIRVLGIDDSSFRFEDKEVIVVGVVMRGGSYLEGVIKTKAKVDGKDGTKVVIELIKNTRHRKQLKVGLIDGVCIGGFNVIDIEKVYEKTKLPIITITRNKPNKEKIENALKKHFKDWKKRLEIINKGNFIEIKTTHKPIFIKFIGLNEKEVKEIIKLTTIRGALPEAIRIAHLIATAFVRGESKGKA